MLGETVPAHQKKFIAGEISIQSADGGIFLFQNSSREEN